jgi:hypothetical protein
MVRRRRRSLLPVVFLIVAAVTAANVWYFGFRGGSRPEGGTPARLAAPAKPLPPTPLPSPRATPTLPPGMPELSASDAFVRDLAKLLSSNPRFAEWLVTDHLVRRFVVVVENVAEGSSPRKQLGFLEPKGHMLAKGEGARFVIDPKSFERYDTVARVVASLDAAGTIALYRRLEPLVEQAYAELGVPDRRFSDTLGRALDALLAVPVVEGPIELDPKVATYELVDPKLRRLTAAQKHFLRMGPTNVLKVQEKLRALRAALEASKGDAEEDAEGVDAEGAE